MEKFTQIYRSEGAYGGVSYRATSNGKHVHLQSSEDLSKPWKTRAKITQATWEKYAKKFDVFNPYNRDPGHVFYILQLYGLEDDPSAEY
jgi:hypothetical protein